MQASRLGVVAALALSAWLGVPACGGQAAKGDGSESHFVGCRTDADCSDAGPGARCVAGKCASPSSVDGGSDGSLGDGGDFTPAACRVDATATGPFATSFHFTNASNAPVSLGNGCGLDYQVTSCADGYRDALLLFAYCGTVCPEVPSCVSGSCSNEPTPVTSAESVTAPWDGNAYVTHTVPAGQCVTRAVAPAGRYRISVPVYPSVLPTMPGGGPVWNPLYAVNVDFTLPARGAVVEIPIDRPSSDLHADSGGASPTCTPVMARKYDLALDCYLPAGPIPGLCLREQEPQTTSGSAEIDCLVSDGGARYAFAKGYTERLESGGWTTNDFGVGVGWTVKGNSGLYLQDTALIGPEGGVVPDGACLAAMTRGHWAYGPLGNPLGVTLLAGDAGSYAPECP